MNECRNKHKKMNQKSSMLNAARKKMDAVVDNINCCRETTNKNITIKALKILPVIQDKMLIEQ